MPLYRCSAPAPLRASLEDYGAPFAAGTREDYGFSLIAFEIIDAMKSSPGERCRHFFFLEVTPRHISRHLFNLYITDAIIWRARRYADGISKMPQRKRSAGRRHDEATLEICAPTRIASGHIQVTLLPHLASFRRARWQESKIHHHQGLAQRFNYGIHFFRVAGQRTRALHTRL